ncbi:hypothetical protein ABVT39_008555 [Epinephelus coioides]
MGDSFVKTRKKVSASGSAGGSQREWKYMDIMSFLVPHLQPRSSKSNLSAALSEENRSLTPLSACGSDEQAPSSVPVPQDRQGPQSVSPAQTVSAAPSAPTTSGETDRPHRSRSPRERGSRTDTRRSHRPQLSDVEDWLMSLLQEPLPKPDSQLDECYHFALSLVLQLHRLDQNRRQQAKIGILNLLHNLESSTASLQMPLQSPAPTQTRPAFHTPATPLLGPGTFRPITHPPVNPIGPFTSMLASEDDPQWERSSTPYTDL